MINGIANIASTPVNHITLLDGLVNTSESNYCRAYIGSVYAKVYYNPTDDSIYSSYDEYSALTINSIEWYAIGVGEEDTSKGLNILSATELPTTGVDNQICVITDNPTSEIFVGQFEDDLPSGFAGIYMLLSPVATTNAFVIEGIPSIKLHFLYAKQNNTQLKSYLYKDNSWKLLTDTEYILAANGVRYYEDLFGYFTKTGGDSSTWDWIDGKGYVFDISLKGEYLEVKNATAIDLSKFNTITITVTDNSSSLPAVFDGTGPTLMCYSSTGEILAETDFYRKGTHTLDISSCNGMGYIGLHGSLIGLNDAIIRFVVSKITIQ